MPEFNNINYELTNGEKFALVCGMLAGLKLGKKQNNTVTKIILKPIGVGGYGTIGLMSNDYKYTGTRQISIPVVTHDVDIGYSGFGLLATYDSNRLRVNSISKGEIDNVQLQTQITSGRAYAACMFQQGTIVNEPKIVCWLNCTILDEPTENNPITVNFVNGSGSDPNYCCLLKWVQVSGQWFSYFITPTVNKGFKIVSDLEDKKTDKNTLGDSTETPVVESPNMVALGSSYIEPAGTALVPIYTNSNESTDFPYNKVSFRAKILKSGMVHLTLTNFVGRGDWNIDVESSDDEEYYYYDIVASRDKSNIGTETIGFIQFVCDSDATVISTTITCENPVLINDTMQLGVIGYDGYVYYSWTPPRNYGNGGGATGAGGGISSGAGSGGAYGTGTIWSATYQTIWIGFGGVWYPIYLKPGNNTVSLMIPLISYKEEVKEIVIEIEAEGYILIPGGFMWSFNLDPDAPPLPISSPRIIDKFEIKDLYDIEIYQKPAPKDLDNLIDDFDITDFGDTNVIHLTIKGNENQDEFDINDFVNVDVRHLTKKYQDHIDKIEIQDIYDIEIEKPYIPPEPIDIDGIIDNFGLVDKAETEIIHLNISNRDSYDDFSLNDFVDIDIIHLLKKYQDNIDGFEIVDIANIFIPRKLAVTGKVNDDSYGSINGLGKYLEGTIVTLTAITNVGYIVDRWEVNGETVSTEDTYSFLVEGNTEVYLILAQNTEPVVIPYITLNNVGCFDTLLNKTIGFNINAKVWNNLMIEQEDIDTDDRGFSDDGIVSIFDGIENTYNGHNNNTSIWNDLLGEKIIISTNSKGFCNVGLVNSFDGFDNTLNGHNNSTDTWEDTKDK